MNEPLHPLGKGLVNKRFLFIVGAPRSGTTWVHQMLAEHPEVAAIPQEMTLFSKYLAPAAKAYEEEAMHLRNGDWSQGLPLVIGEEEFRKALLMAVDRVYGRIAAKKPDAGLIIDKHPHYAAHLPFINSLLPDCLVLHIIRDGRDVAVSTMRTKRLKGHGEGTIEGAAQVWVNRVRQSMNFGKAVGPARYMEVRYEELVSSTSQSLAAILGFAGITADAGFLERVAAEFDMRQRTVSGGDASLNDLRRRPGAIWSTKLLLHERYLYNRIAGGLLVELGYAGKEWWMLRWTDRPRLLFWLLRKRASLLRKAVMEAMRYPRSL